MAFVQCALSNIRYRVFPVLLLLLLLAPTVCQAGSYQQKKDIHDTVLASSRYLPYERPLRDQSDVLHVYAAFELVSIDEINDVMQTFKCNGFLSLSWTDEVCILPVNFWLISFVFFPWQQIIIKRLQRIWIFGFSDYFFLESRPS